jgi:hypothetical protein
LRGSRQAPQRCSYPSSEWAIVRVLCGFSRGALLIELLLLRDRLHRRLRTADRRLRFRGLTRFFNSSRVGAVNVWDRFAMVTLLFAYSSCAQTVLHLSTVGGCLAITRLELPPTAPSHRDCSRREGPKQAPARV